MLRLPAARLPPALRPGWIARIGISLCGVFYLGFAGLVFYQKQLPLLLGLFK